MKRTKTNRGITLIALIITIVVLLILAVVAINSITNEGIIAHTTNSTGTYNNSVSNEKGTLNEYEDYLNPCNRNGHKWDKESKTCLEKEDVEATCTICGEKGTLYWSHTIVSDNEGEYYCSICDQPKDACAHDETGEEYAINGGLEYHYYYQDCYRCGEAMAGGDECCDFSDGTGICSECGDACEHNTSCVVLDCGSGMIDNITEVTNTTHSGIKVCDKCGLTVTITNEEHYDLNQDNKCDECGIS